ncbi:securin-like [Hyperolius riggenbachi]|uniref:securin-like n=1 Tax=Hyperolius riggenbachi TaxID=752182 RepID=UPI0035A32655
MATLVFVDQENGNVGSSVSKDQLKRTANTAEPVLRAPPGKVFGQSGAEKTTRKALGNVNKQVVSQKAVPAQKSHIKVKKQAPVIKEVTGAQVKPNKPSYPEIDRFIPYDLTEFDTFDVPEEHKLSHLCLVGVPLMVAENDALRFEALVNKEPAPMDIPVFSWETDVSDNLPCFLSPLEVSIDMPELEW